MKVNFRACRLVPQITVTTYTQNAGLYSSAQSQVNYANAIGILLRVPVPGAMKPFFYGIETPLCVGLRLKV